MAGYAQNDVQKIKDHYYEVGKLIKECSGVKANQDSECSLYSDELQINKGGNSWRAVGNYNKKIVFWYNDDPDNCDGCEEVPGLPLLKVQITEIVSAFKYYEEYLFLDGELIFLFKTSDNEDGNIEQRYYVANKKLIKFLCNKDNFQNKSDIAMILKKANKLQDLFVNYH